MNSFVMSNMTPQFCQFNEGIWQELEDLTRRWSKSHGVYVVTGAVFDRDHDGKRDPDSAAFHMSSHNGKRRVAVPSAYYKIISYEVAGGGLSTLTVLLPHDQANQTGAEAVTYLQAHVVKIDEVEKLTGLKFYPTGAPAISEATTLWPFDGPAPASLGLGKRCRATAGAVIH
jgi:endonuclease G